MAPPTVSRLTAYITTPIYYVNDQPHVGHVYTTTLCDVWARFMRLLGRDVFFLTGTDEHGLKVEKAARERGITPQALADENAAVYQRVMKEHELTHDEFIRTTSEAHKRQVAAFVRRLVDAGAVYLGEFEGWYDEGQEEYYTETKARSLDFRSPVNRKPLVRAREKNYYFRLSAFQQRLEKLFDERPGFVRPAARHNEVLGRLREGLQDVPISRTNFSWGVAMPGDPEHVIYVWIEALMNYVTALGLGEPGSAWHAARAKYWPPDYHVIGKEILWFHTVVWPAVLLALELPLPKCVYAHSFWISEGQKMSKTLGNFVDLASIERYIDAYGIDMWRFFLVTQGPLGATDADLSSDHFHDIYNADLVNTIGNCTSRVTAMVNKYCGGLVPNVAEGARGLVEGNSDWPGAAADTVRAATEAMERFDLAGAVAAAISLVRRIDGFINETEPYKLAKDPGQSVRLAGILYQCLESLRIASVLLSPVLIHGMPAFWRALAVPAAPAHRQLASLAAWGGLAPGTRIEKVALYPRVERAGPTPIDREAVDVR